ncbi:MAG: TatD family hydrolase [Chthonomonas sp.]|nr:TatD family hydrolase [Chthonomonas sp.]
MIDTHCHLNDFEAFPDPAKAVIDATEAGVNRLVVIGIDEEWSRRAVALAEQFDSVWAVVGHHPNAASTFSQDSLDLYRLLWANPKVIAIGEIGLDFYRDRATPKEQHYALQAQLDLAGELGAPLVFHCRDAYDELLPVLEGRPRQPYLMHCWAGSMEQAQRANEIGCYFGVDGPVTYRKNDELREVLAWVPLDRLVIETDAPWLPPEPHRGQRNHPKFLPFIASKLAEIRGLEKDQMIRQLNENAGRFFGPKFTSELGEG